jgi:hypothetical protein
MLEAKANKASPVLGDEGKKGPSTKVSLFAKPLTVVLILNWKG